MTKIIRVEELGLFLLSVVLFSATGYDWWWFPVLLFLPDLSMIGYLFTAKTGAFVYNLFHHRGVAVLLYGIGFYTAHPLTELVGIILLAHSSMDRIFGYGLKYADSFRHTHLGWIGSPAGGE
jgi:hypothetical protein